MKKILFLACLLSSSAFAAVDGNEDAVFNFTFFGNTSGRYTMVSCDYAEYVAVKAMEKFGAKKIEARCSGGITPTGVFPLGLRVTYVAPDVTRMTRVEKVKYISNPGESNCDFDTAVVNALIRDFPNVEPGRRQDTCFRSDSPYSFELTITLPR